MFISQEPATGSSLRLFTRTSSRNVTCSGKLRTRSQVQHLLLVDRLGRRKIMIMDRRNTIVRIIQDVSKKDITPAADESLFDSGLLDSFALPDVVSALEEEFGLKIPDSDLN